MPDSRPSSPHLRLPACTFAFAGRNEAASKVGSHKTADGPLVGFLRPRAHLSGGGGGASFHSGWWTLWLWHIISRVLLDLPNCFRLALSVSATTGTFHRLSLFSLSLSLSILAFSPLRPTLAVMFLVPPSANRALCTDSVGCLQVTPIASTPFSPDLNEKAWPGRA